MKNQQDNLGSQDGKIDLKMWMEEHPQEYGEFAAAMGEADGTVCCQSTLPLPQYYLSSFQKSVHIWHLTTVRLLSALANG